MDAPHRTAFICVMGLLSLHGAILFSPCALADSSSLFGGSLGLNTIPTARMDIAGTGRVGVARSAPYTHVAAGIQLTPSLFVGLRQTYEAENFNDTATHLYPGIDAKLLLVKEKKFRPAIAAGVQSAFGHKRMAGEYITLSKRYHAFDMTVGGGWGRMGTRQVFGNPLLTQHLGASSDRTLDGDDPQRLSDFFKGRMGVFAGLSYDTQLDGLTLKFDWSSDDWDAEKNADTNFDAPAPWALGFSYRPLGWLDVGLAWAGGDHIMSRVSISQNLDHWPLTASTPLTAQTHPPLFRKKNTTDLMMSSDVALLEGHSAPEQLGIAARLTEPKAAKSVHQLAFQLRRYGLKGPEIALSRRDVQLGVSPEEVWENAVFPDRLAVRGLFRTLQGLRLDLVNEASLSEEDNGILYRSGLIPTYFKHFKKYFLSEQALRINLADNLESLNDFRGLTLLPVRSNLDAFAAKRFTLERNLITAMGTPLDDVHVALSSGYFEEMYGGMGGEILYRPFGKAWAVGVDATIAMKRDPATSLALGFNGDHILTGHITGYYELPGTSTTASLAVGRYLAGDTGGTLGLDSALPNGLQIGGKMTITNAQDTDIYGDKTNVYAGLELSLPLGSLSFLPDGSRARIKSYPLGRDTGQMLERPHRLYDLSEPLSYRAIMQHWTQWQRRSP